MSSGKDPDKILSRTNAQTQGRVRANFVDLALGRTPFSNSINNRLQKESQPSPAADFVSMSSRQRTEPHFSFSSGQEGLNFAPDMENLAKVIKEAADDGGTENEGGDQRVRELLERLKAVEEQLVNQHSTPEVIRSDFPDVHSDHHHFPPDNYRVHIHDVPERFHAGRESLSVRRNVTIRDSKRPKERAQDREYKQRFSLSPGGQLGGRAFAVHEFGENLDQRSLTQPGVKPLPTLYGQQASSGNSSSPAGIAMRHMSQSPLSVPSPLSDDQIAVRRTIGGGGHDDYSFIITLICEGDRMQHQVWKDMPVSQLTRDAAGLFGLTHPLSTIILMLFGLNPSTLRFDCRLSDPPQVNDGATVLVFQISNSTHRGMLPAPPGGAHPGGHLATQPVQNFVPPLPQNPKFLGNFKLTKFDGSVK